jgi:rhodanese-related sulfurtransferase
MAKRPHHEASSNSSRNTLIVMTIGGLLVAALVGWALTRSVEPAPTATATTPVPATDTAAVTPPPGSTTGIQTDAPQFAPPAASATANDPVAKITRIAPEDVRPKHTRNEVTIIDVRDAASYAASHIPGALHIPLARIEGEIQYLPKDKQIVTYCSCPAEESSGEAAAILAQKGITNVAALHGGMQAWQALGYPVKSGDQP